MIKVESPRICNAGTKQAQRLGRFGAFALRAEGQAEKTALSFFLLFSLSLLLVAIVLSALQVEAAENLNRTVVHVRTSAQISGASITLGSIADITVVDATDSDNEHVLAQLILGESPAAGKTVTWSAPEISKRLRSYTRLLQNVQTKVPDHISIKRVLNVISREELARQIETTLMASVPDPTWEVKVTDLNVSPNGLELPPESTVQVIAPVSRPRGAANFEIAVATASSESSAAKHQWITGRVKYFARVATLTRQIDIRTRVTNEDVKWERRDVTALAEVPATATDMATATARATLNAGGILTRNMLEREMALRFGEEVEISAGGDSFQVTMKGISQQNGFIGDTVNVKNTANNKILTGTIVAKGIVQVRY